jgi:hypothetical protein
MKQLYKHNDVFYIIHKIISIALFSDKDGIIDLEGVKMWRDYLPLVDHVLRNESHFSICRNNPRSQNGGRHGGWRI